MRRSAGGLSDLNWPLMPLSPGMPCKAQISRAEKNRSPRLALADEAGGDRLLGVAALAVGGHVPCVLAGQHADGLAQLGADIVQADAVLGRVARRQGASGDQVAEG